MKTKLSGKFWAALTLFSLMGQVAWVVENMYLNVFIYKMFNASADDISLMVSASAISATLTTVIMGALSDKIGKRKLFICGGYIAWGISILGFALLKMDVIEAVFPAAISAASV
ncbi:MAG: MFS transporter, partial [Clostridia bacterium]|nr:MFS transporter [Clostridia bacterium]